MNTFKSVLLKCLLVLYSAVIIVLMGSGLHQSYRNAVATPTQLPSANRMP